MSDGSYDTPSVFLDQVPQLEAVVTCQDGYCIEQNGHSVASPAGHNGHSVATEDPSNLVEESGAYSSVDDFIPEIDGGSSCGSSLEEEEKANKEDRRREGKKIKCMIRQSQSSNESSDKIYVRGNIIPHQPMLSFKSRARAHSREELEQEGIYQGLVITDEQKQQLGIMPESIYMTVALENCHYELEYMSMEIEAKPG